MAATSSASTTPISANNVGCCTVPNDACCTVSGLRRVESNMVRCLVSLSEVTVALAISLRGQPDEPMDQVIRRALNLLAAAQSGTPQRSGGTRGSVDHPSDSTKHRLSVLGQSFTCFKKQDVLAQVLDEFSRRDPSFLARFANERGRTRRFVSQSRDLLYPGSPHLAKYARDLEQQLVDGHELFRARHRGVDDGLSRCRRPHYGSQVSVKFGGARPVSTRYNRPRSTPELVSVPATVPVVCELTRIPHLHILGAPWRSGLGRLC